MAHIEHASDLADFLVRAAPELVIVDQRHADLEAVRRLLELSGSKAEVRPLFGSDD